MQVALSVLCTSSFLAPPRVQLGYNAAGQTINQTLPLPLSVGKFCTPPGAAVPREAFFARWRAVQGALCAPMHMFDVRPSSLVLD